ncbi:predicted protein [Nematostella vectensis]|uniref:Mitochondrial import inner membrane translocase subunit Tim21 n=1 Tax=Nematostella vectensis TaxID=45351 RepID=A7SM72_NEMVE|nr:predicted protein [Nematostella vectensis]|eukprot:XP_001627269.1 predicted protein [Nematostella vectensis]
MARIFATIKRLSRFSTTTFSNGIFQPRQQTRNFHAFFRESVPRNVQNSAITQRNWLNSAINEGNARRFNYSTGVNDKRTFKQRLWRILRVLFLVTGGAVWGLPALVYFGYLSGFVEIDVREKDESEIRKSASDEYTNRMLEFFDVAKNLKGEERFKEIGDKHHALTQIWNKLRSEDGVVKKFGKPVELSGYQVRANKVTDQFVFAGGSDDPEIIKDHLVEQEQDTISSENGTTWTVSCYVEGSKLTGVLQVEFSRVNKDWVPVSIHLETVQKTGDVICNVSGPLPNGVTRFTRLSND